MPGSFAITTVSNNVPLDDSRKSQVAFTVSNTSTQPMRGRANIVPLTPVAAPWLSLLGEPERTLPAAATEQYTVQLNVPSSIPAGSYSFRLDMVGVDNPDEDFVQGPSVSFTVPAPVPVKKPFPWWIVAVAAAVLVILIIAYFLYSNSQNSAAADAASKTATAQALQTSAANEATAASQTAAAQAAGTQTASAQTAGSQTVAAQGAATQTAAAQGASQASTATAQAEAEAAANQTATAQAVANQTAAAEGAANQTATAQAVLANRVTTVQLTTSPSSSAARGQAVTLAGQVSTVDGKTPTGSVTFLRDGSSISECPNPVSLSSGSATCVTSSLATGSHTLTASYGGDSEHDTSQAPDLAFTIAPANTSTTVSANSSYNGIPVWKYDASATVSNTSSGVALVPTGTVTFHFSDRAAVNRDASCTLSSGACSVSFTDSLLYYVVSATYAPDSGDFSGSSGAQVGTGR